MIDIIPDFAPEQKLKCIRTPTGFLITLYHFLHHDHLRPRLSRIVRGAV